MKKQFIIVTIVALFTLIIGGAAWAGSGNVEEKANNLEEKVQGGIITEEAAEEYLEALQERRDECEDICDGTRQGWDEDRERLGQLHGIRGFGHGRGSGVSDEDGEGFYRHGRMDRTDQRLQDGSCGGRYLNYE